MAEDIRINEKQRIRNFFNRLVVGNYHIDGKSSFQVVYDSYKKYPQLNDLKDDDIKLKQLVNLLVKELQSFGRKVSSSKIKNDLRTENQKRRVLVYQVLFYDEKDMNFYDYFFILDTKVIRLFCFRRLKHISNKSRYLVKVISYLHRQVFMDAEEIYKLLKGKGLITSYQQILHLIHESDIN
ncbi:MAG: hypothetical protein IEMM0008_0917 [bacterium]|nr:MAG: hypothetical protein IEMM0008_0917 [bacterium]